MMAFVTGGASSGKSAFSERLCMELGQNRVYLAAMRPFGLEGEERVAKHRAQRAGKGFHTVECYEDFGAAAGDEHLAGATVLLECLGNVVANELFSNESEGALPAGREPIIARKLAEDVRLMGDRAENLVVVGNEVGADGVSYPNETRAYQRVLGALSAELARRSDIVVECVTGVPIALKGAGLLPSGAALRGGEGGRP